MINHANEKFNPIPQRLRKHQEIQILDLFIPRAAFITSNVKTLPAASLLDLKTLHLITTKNLKVL